MQKYLIQREHLATPWFNVHEEPVCMVTASNRSCMIANCTHGHAASSTCGVLLIQVIGDSLFLCLHHKAQTNKTSSIYCTLLVLNHILMVVIGVL